MCIAEYSGTWSGRRHAISSSSRRRENDLDTRAVDARQATRATDRGSCRLRTDGRGVAYKSLAAKKRATRYYR
jgi:IS5 family transposase